MFFLEVECMLQDDLELERQWSVEAWAWGAQTKAVRVTAVYPRMAHKADRGEQETRDETEQRRQSKSKTLLRKGRRCSCRIGATHRMPEARGGGFHPPYERRAGLWNRL